MSAVAIAPAVDWTGLLIGLAGGLALFLGGLEVLAQGLRLTAGASLRNVLQRLTLNRFMGVLTGALVTGVLNSSSVTTVLVVGFVTAGLMSLSQSVGVIMGANIGSTVTAQILAFDVAAYALVLVALGFFCYFAGKRERFRHVGLMILGLGLVFYGMGLMSEAMKPLRLHQPLVALLAQMQNPVFGILAGAMFTGLVQSSAATVGIAIVMAGEGLLTLPAGIALALGANVGTCVTALLASLGKPAEAVRAGVVHVCFNVVGVVVWLPFIPLLGELAVAVSPVDQPIAAVGASADVPRQIANANTLFNVINTCLFIGFAPWFARLAEVLVKDRPLREGALIQPEYLDDNALQAPNFALENVRREIGRVGGILLDMMDRIGRALRDRDERLLDDIIRSRHEVETLSTAVLGYLGRIRQAMLTEQESETLQSLMVAIHHLDGLAAHFHRELGATVRTFIVGSHEPSSDITRDLVQGVWETVRNAIAMAARAIEAGDPDAAEAVVLLEERVKRLGNALFERRAVRLKPGDARYLTKVRLLLALIGNLQQCYILARHIAETRLPTELPQMSDDPAR